MVDKVPAQITPGTASRGSVVHASDAGVGNLSRSHDEEDISRLQSAAIAYSALLTYEIGDFVVQTDDVYRCNTAIAVPEAFNASKWTIVGMPQTPWESNIDGGAFSLENVEFLGIDEIAQPSTPTANQIRLYAEDESGFAVLKYINDSGFVTNVTQDSVFPVRNISGVTILTGSVVHITGAQGKRITVDLAKADSDSTMPGVGVALADIPNNSNGLVLLEGLETGLNTSSFTAGDILYVSDTVAGEFTTTKPTHPNLEQVGGIITESNPTTGEIIIQFGSLNGDESGTISNSFKVGDANAGAKTVDFVNTFTGSLSWNPTAARTQTLQDADGTIALTTDITTQIADRRFNFRSKRDISLDIASGTNFNLSGLGSTTITEEGTNISILDATGLYADFEATAVGMGTPGGLFAPDCVRRDLNFDIEFKFRLNDLANVQFVAGFLELDPFVNAPEDNEHVALVRDAAAGNTNFLISHSDGGGTVTETQIAVADTSIHTFRVVSDESNTKFQYSWDGGALVDLTTNIPAATTNLILYIEAITSLGTRTVDLWYLDGFADA